MTDGRIEFLMEKDIEYFQKLAEKGEAVVLTISEEDLLSLDFTKPVPGFEDAEINTQEELDQWVHDYKEEFRRLYSDNQETVDDSQKIREQIEASERSDEDVQAKKSQGQVHKSDAGKTSEPASNLAERLTQVQLDPDKMEIVNCAFRAGLNDQTILLLLQDGYTAEEMKEMCDLFIRNKERS